MNLSRTGKGLLIAWLLLLVFGHVALVWSECIDSTAAIMWLVSGLCGTVMGSIIASFYTKKEK